MTTTTTTTTRNRPRKTKARWKVTTNVILTRVLLPLSTAIYAVSHYLVWIRHNHHHHHHHHHQESGNDHYASSGNGTNRKERQWEKSRTMDTRKQQSQQTPPSPPQPSPSTTHTCFNGTTWNTWPKGPDFIIAGTQKGGTTALYALLCKHPHILPSTLFEGHFFDMHYGVLRHQLEGRNNIRGEALHCQLFEAYMRRLGFPGGIDRFNATTATTTEKGGRIWTFEKTPNYMIWPHVPAAIVETCPWKPKIVIVLRNPIDRLYSQYRMNFVSRPNDVPDLETELERELGMLRKYNLSVAPDIKRWERDRHHQKENSSYLFTPPLITSQQRDSKDSIQFRGFGNHGFFPRYLLRGMYVYQLQRWRKHFDESELLVVPYHRMRSDMRNVWQEILDFVGIPQHDLTHDELTTSYRPSIEGATKNGTAPLAVPMSNVTREYLIEFFRPYNELLADLLGEEWRGIWNA